MGLANIAVGLVLAVALANAQSNAVSAHSVSLVSAPPATGSPVSVHPVSMVPSPTGSAGGAPPETDVSTHPVSLVPAPLTLSWSSTEIPLPTSSTAASGSKSNKATIAGGVVGGLAAIVLAAIGAFVFLRLRRRSTRHWRNRTAGTWQDVEGRPSPGPIYVGQPFDRPFDGYNHDMKVPVASPTTPTVAPLFIREPRIAQPFSGPQRGHTRGSSSSAHYRDNSATYMEMQGNPGSPTSESRGSPNKF
ncbi:hypothetical protein C8R44DRAFT_812899 [Mycena epipterygia]|nr:hypothetical protein C8R44DRAFT_812899 [Mycena epipterygia]